MEKHLYNYMLLVIRAASSLMDDFSMSVLGDIFVGCIGRLRVD
jgi:hypothetical protein